jgi:membrane protein
MRRMTRSGRSTHGRNTLHWRKTRVTAQTTRSAQAAQDLDVQPWHERIAGYGNDLFFKFMNDFTMSLVSMVAFSVLTSFVPLILAVVLVLALLPGSADSVHGFASQIDRVLPAAVSKDANITGLIHSIHSASGILTLVTIVGLIWGGTNLFGSIETAFAFVYRVKTRDIVPQKLMALVLILLFVVLLPLSFVSSLLLAATTTTLGRIMPSALHGSFSAALGLAAGFVSLFLLFVAIYTIVPNMQIAWRHAWRGALVASVAVWLVNTAFPFYAAHFLGTGQYGVATIGTVIITITWVWFFSLVLLLGAQINALGMGLVPWKYDITRILMETEGPFLESKRQPRPHRQHRPLPFSGLIRDSYKVLPTPKSRRAAPKYKKPRGGSASPTRLRDPDRDSPPS